MQPAHLSRLACALLAGAAFAVPASATWSIVAVNTKTGEVLVAGATCLEDFNLAKNLPVMRVGRGGGVSQGLIDTFAQHRLKIWNGLIAGDSPDAIINTLVTTGSIVQSRQWGVVDLAGAPATFSGTSLGVAYFGVAGTAGDVRYAIQGNVITAALVVQAAEAALLSTPGDMTQRVLAGMEAARALGGDGRCSCLTGLPDSCGAPPPGFTKSAHCSFFVASRIGDKDGTACTASGCATGQYYLNLNISGDWSDADPVLELESQYDAWRLAKAGHPDQLKSSVTPPSAKLVADGATSTAVLVRLADIEGQPLLQGGASLTLEKVGGGAPLASPGAVVDHGDGSYTIPFSAGLVAGDDSFAIRVDDGTQAVTLYPYLELSVEPLAELFAGADSISAGAAGASVPFVVNLGASAALHPFILLASASGTLPGVDLGGELLALNPDGILQYTLLYAGGPVLPGSVGVLDAAGRAEAAFSPPPGALATLVGVHLDWAAVDYAGPYAATNTVGLDIVP